MLDACIAQLVRAVDRYIQYCVILKNFLLISCLSDAAISKYVAWSEETVLIARKIEHEVFSFLDKRSERIVEGGKSKEHDYTREPRCGLGPHDWQKVNME